MQASARCRRNSGWRWRSTGEVRSEEDGGGRVFGLYCSWNEYFVIIIHIYTGKIM